MILFLSEFQTYFLCLIFHSFTRIYQDVFFFEFILIGLAEIFEFIGWCILENFGEKQPSYCLFFSFKKIIYLSVERGEGREK